MAKIKKKATKRERVMPYTKVIRFMCSNCGGEHTSEKTAKICCSCDHPNDFISFTDHSVVCSYCGKSFEFSKEIRDKMKHLVRLVLDQ